MLNATAGNTGRHLQEEILDGLTRLDDTFLWGPPMLVLLVGTGVLLTVRLRGVQLRRLPKSLYLAFVVREEEGEGDISHFQALMTSLSATVGTGNIVGVAVAIGAGGPGALAWMWLAGLVGMATKYGEALLGVRHRVRDAEGAMNGGPMYYLRDGLPWPRLGTYLAGAFALFTTVASFGTGNMVQANAVADALSSTWDVPRVVIGLVTAALLASVIFGGIKSIGRTVSILTPAMILLYVGAALVVLGTHASEVPGAFELVFASALEPVSAAGGFAGSTIAMAIRQGVSRGVFSNEAGLGTGAITAAAAETDEPVRQAMVSMTQTFIDTLVVCTLTGLTILVTGAWSSDEAGASLTSLAFDDGIPGGFGDLVVPVCLSLFAYSTLLGWSYIGERGAEYLFGTRIVRPYRILFVLLIVPGALFELDLVWAFADAANALMAIPNLVGILALSGVVVAETRRYLGSAEVEQSLEPPVP